MSLASPIPASPPDAATPAPSEAAATFLAAADRLDALIATGAPLSWFGSPVGPAPHPAVPALAAMLRDEARVAQIVGDHHGLSLDVARAVLGGAASSPTGPGDGEETYGTNSEAQRGAEGVAPASPEAPVYTARPQTHSHLWLVTCDEGWRSSVVCSGMYEWAALWLVEQLAHRPFAPETRP